jgi:transcriptional regulator with XRE-family HTH domain
MAYQKHVSTLIKDLIADGWTQDAIARATGASQGHISALAHERVNNPSYFLVTALMALAHTQKAA